MRRRAQFSIRTELTRLSVCVRFRCACACASDVRARASDVCAENFSQSVWLFRQQSRACLRAVLISSPDMWDWKRMHALVVMHRRTLYENVDSAKIKVPFYTTDIDILSVASMHRIVIHWIDISTHIDELLHPYYPSIHPSIHLLASVYLATSDNSTIYVMKWSIILIPVQKKKTLL